MSKTILSIPLYDLFYTQSDSMDTIITNSNTASENASSVNTTHINNLIVDNEQVVLNMIQTKLATILQDRQNSYVNGFKSRDLEVAEYRKKLSDYQTNISSANTYINTVREYTFSKYVSINNDGDSSLLTWVNPFNTTNYPNRSNIIIPDVYPEPIAIPSPP